MRLTRHHHILLFLFLLRRGVFELHVVIAIEAHCDAEMIAVVKRMICKTRDPDFACIDQVGDEDKMRVKKMLARERRWCKASSRLGQWDGSE